MSKAICIIIIITNLIFSFQANIKGVVELDSSNFDTKVVNDEFVYVIKLYSEMCGSCQEFQPTWEKFAVKNSGKYKLGQVNIDKKPGMELANKLNALREGIPALMVFTDAMSKDYKLIVTEGASIDTVTKEINKAAEGLKVDVTGFTVKNGAKTIGDI